jgi:hypothetical protein
MTRWLAMENSMVSDQAREDFIAACGQRFLAAFNAGDMEGAQIWLAAQTKEVLARSPEQVARMERAYFAECAQEARRAVA